MPGTKHSSRHLSEKWEGGTATRDHTGWNSMIALARDGFLPAAVRNQDIDNCVRVQLPEHSTHNPSVRAFFRPNGVIYADVAETHDPNNTLENDNSRVHMLSFVLTGPFPDWYETLHPVQPSTTTSLRDPLFFKIAAVYQKNSSSLDFDVMNDAVRKYLKLPETLTQHVRYRYYYKDATLGRRTQSTAWTGTNINIDGIPNQSHDDGWSGLSLRIQNKIVYACVKNDEKINCIRVQVNRDAPSHTADPVPALSPTQPPHDTTPTFEHVNSINNRTNMISCVLMGTCPSWYEGPGNEPQAFPHYFTTPVRYSNSNDILGHKMHDVVRNHLNLGGKIRKRCSCVDNVIND